MTVVDSRLDRDARTLSFVAEFDASLDRVWRLWSDPRLLERWWGPPTWPAMVTRHEFVPGGRVDYHMTGPDGTRSHGWWQIVEIDEGHRLVFDDGFADPDGTPSAELGSVRGVVTLESRDPGGCRVDITTTFASPEQLESMLGMGMEEGMRQAMGQMDAVLAG